MRRKLSLVLWSLVVAASVTASAQDVEKALNTQYKDKILALRHARQVNKQEYDSAGAVVGDNAEGPWTLYGRIRVEKITVMPTRLELKGRRVPYRLDKRTQQLVPFKDGQKATILIRLDKPLTAADDEKAILEKVFAFSNQDIVNAAPDWWRHYLSLRLGLIPALPPATAKLNAGHPTATPPDAQAVQEAKAAAQSGSGLPATEEIVEVGKTVQRPKVLYQPEPQFSKEARDAKYQGLVGLSVIIDRTGVIRRVLIVRAAGMGLDEQAVQGVKAWRFEPATRNGEPVAVAVYVEVAFNFY